MVPTTPAFLRLAGHPLRWQLLSALATGDHRVRELSEVVGERQNLVSYHLRLLREGGLVGAHRSTFDGRDTYYRLDLERCAGELTAAGAALHPWLRLGPPAALADLPRRRRSTTVLFACTGNSARSPIAEAILRHRSAGRVTVASAGSHPRPQIHAAVVAAMRAELGIDLGDQRPRHLDSMTRRRFDYVITLCDKVREVHPRFDSRPRLLHWSLPDPLDDADGRSDLGEAVSRTITDLDTRIQHLLPELATTTEVAP
jgi:protein-tyrosine-phosphatase/DNA-binding transcriptional ArsR family regulator